MDTLTQEVTHGQPDQTLGPMALAQEGTQAKVTPARPRLAPAPGVRYHQSCPTPFSPPPA